MGNRLESHEKSAILILRKYFHEKVTPLEPSGGFKRKTPDLEIGGLLWELKSPTTSKLVALEYRFKKASKQSKYIVMDFRRIAIEEEKALGYIVRLSLIHKSVKRLLIIKKDRSIVVIK